MNDDLHISERGLRHVMEFEGLRLRAYQDVAGVWTIGYGHTRTAHPGMVITQPEARSLLKLDIQDAEEAVKRLIKVPLSQNQFDALVSWTFNLGEGALAESTLRRRLNGGEYTAVPDEMQRWNKATNPETGRKEVVDGLVRRRKAEAAMWSEAPRPEEPKPKEADMAEVVKEGEATKKWYASKGVWGGIVAVVAAIAAGFGYQLGPEAQGDLVTALAAIGGAVGGVVAVAGRVVASKKIG